MYRQYVLVFCYFYFGVLMTHCRIRLSLTSEGNWIMHAMIKKYIHCELNFHARCLPSIGLVLFKLVDIQRQLDKGRHRRSKQLIAITVQPKTACTSSLKDTRSAEDQCEIRILLFLRHNIIAFNSYRNQRSIKNLNSHAVKYERMILCYGSALNLNMKQYYCRRTAELATGSHEQMQDVSNDLHTGLKQKT